MKHFATGLRYKFLSSMGLGCMLLGSPMGDAALAGAPQSSATGLDAHFVVSGTGTEFGPVDPLLGNATGAYNDSLKVGQVNGMLVLSPSSPAPLQTVALYVNAEGFLSHVSSSGVNLDSRNSESNTHMANASLAIDLYPLPPTASTGPVPYPFLSVTSGSVKSQTNFTQVFPNSNSAQGSAQIASLTIQGAAVNGATLTFSGNAQPNTVIYDTPTVTITLNKQVKDEIISCTVPGGCTSIVEAMTTDAIDINLNKAEWFGHKISGEIVVGETHAQ
jgi:hypothetical protein